MIRNYIITAFRNLKNNLFHASLNVIGLSIGLACCLVVFTIVHFEYSFDDWHSKRDDIYRLTRIYHGDNRTNFSGIVSYPTGDVLEKEIPEIQNIALFNGPEDGKFSFIDKDEAHQIYRENGVLMANEGFLEMLDFQMVRGTSDELKDPFKIILSESIAKKYFGSEDPVGKVITYTYDGTYDLNVIGVIEDSPNNTNLPYELIISFATLKEMYPKIWSQGGMTWAHTIYLQIKKGTDIAKLNIKIDEVLDEKSGNKKEDAVKTEVILQPLSEIHNDEKYGDGYHYVTPSLMIWAFIFLGVIILGTACLNFINLNTAQAIKRSKEIGIRKTLGSNKPQLIFQFLTETLVIVLVSILIALSLGQFLIAQFNQLITTIEYNLHYGIEIISFCAVLALTSIMH